MARGRKPGQGNFLGGRPKGSPNKKGSFEACLPPMRCSQELFNWVSQQANATDKTLSTWLRGFLEAKMDEEMNANNKLLQVTSSPSGIEGMPASSWQTGEQIT